MTNPGLKQEGRRKETSILIAEPVYYYISYYNYSEGVGVRTETMSGVLPRRTPAASSVSKNSLSSSSMSLKRGISPEYYTLWS
jgi:hypothetical protein